MVVYGHTPVPEPEWLNNTICVDTGCVFGGKLTALRYPEKELVSVPALQTYYEPSKPFLPAEEQAPALTAQQAARRCSRYRRRFRQAHHLNRSLSQRHDSRREQHCRARSDEPVCDRSEVADLPAADDVAIGNEPRARLARTSCGGVCLLPASRRRESHLRREAHGFARGGGCLSRSGCCAAALWCRGRHERHLLHAHGAAVFRRSCDGDESSSPAIQKAIRMRAFGRSLRRIGCVSIAS